MSYFFSGEGSGGETFPTPGKRVTYAKNLDSNEDELPDPSVPSTVSSDEADGEAKVRIEAFSYLNKFKKLNDLKQEALAEEFPGAILHGQGKIVDVGKCGFTDDSEAYGSDCIRIKLDKGNPRVVLYFDSSRRSEIMNLSEGAKFSFDNCEAVSVKDWGFWATATCDMAPDADIGDTPKPSSEKASSQGRGSRVEAFSYLKKFKKLNDFKQEALAEEFPGAILHGQGKIVKVGKCGFTDNSEAYGSNCIKVTVDKGSPRVVLYFDSSRRSEIMDLAEGAKFSFDNCEAVSVKDWGFWATATCDMAR